MFQLSYLGNHQSFDLEKGMNLLIVRKPPARIPPLFKHVPQLSPSPQLFAMAQIWKKELGEKENWFSLYEERFLQEITERNDLVRAMNKLEKRINEGIDIRLFCYCKDHEFCHRKYIGQELERRGHQVDWCRKESVEQLSLF